MWVLIKFWNVGDIGIGQRIDISHALLNSLAYNIPVT